MASLLKTRFLLVYALLILPSLLALYNIIAHVHVHVYMYMYLHIMVWIYPVHVYIVSQIHLLFCSIQDVLFAVLVANNQVITFIRPKEHSLLPLGKYYA